MSVAIAGNGIGRISAGAVFDPDNASGGYGSAMGTVDLGGSPTAQPDGSPGRSRMDATFWYKVIVGTSVVLLVLSWRAADGF